MSSQNVCASTLISIYRCKWHETVKSERAVYGSGRISIQLTHRGFFLNFGRRVSFSSMRLFYVPRTNIFSFRKYE